VTKRIILTSLVLLGFGVVASARQPAATASGDKLVAIDIVVEPDQTVIDAATALNARLRQNDPTGFTLDGAHAPHVSLLQRYVRANDLDAVEAAVTKVLAVDRPTDLRLTATGIDYAMWAGSAVTVFAIERTPELMRLQQKVADAVEPFAMNGGTAAAFVGSTINQETIAYVETFVPKSSGASYLPHVTVGVAKQAFVKELKAEPFKSFSGKARGVAVYQLGDFGTAAKKLWEPRPLSSQR
jgi:hypothetical protein